MVVGDVRRAVGAIEYKKTQRSRTQCCKHPPPITTHGLRSHSWTAITYTRGGEKRGKRRSGAGEQATTGRGAGARGTRAESQGGCARRAAGGFREHKPTPDESLNNIRRACSVRGGPPLAAFNTRLPRFYSTRTHEYVSISDSALSFALTRSRAALVVPSSRVCTCHHGCSPTS